MNSNSSLGSIDTNKVSTEFFKFGISQAEGLGYYGPHLSFIPYVSQSLMWTKLNNYNYLPSSSKLELSTNDQDIINRYLDSFRFSDRVLYGFKSDILSSLQIAVNYETGVIYPRHLFLKWAGSFVLVQAGYAGIDYALGKFVDDYPVWGPIINFVARSAYLYAYYLVRKNDMNWPFSTEAPLRYEGFNFGVSFVL